MILRERNPIFSSAKKIDNPRSTNSFDVRNFFSPTAELTNWPFKCLDKTLILQLICYLKAKTIHNSLSVRLVSHL